MIENAFTVSDRVCLSHKKHAHDEIEIETWEIKGKETKIETYKWTNKPSLSPFASLSGKLIPVTPEELAKHNTESDCWIAFRGLVYNVTPYMEFHPGGVDELMRAAGQDGTQLFDEVYP